MNVRIQSAPYVTMAVLDLGGEDDSRSFARDNGALDFGLALVALKAGHRVQRAGWNGKGMWLALTTGVRLTTASELRGAALLRKQELQAEELPALDALLGCSVSTVPRMIVTSDHIDMRAADGSITIGWLASQTDMLAEDWAVLP